MDLKEQGAIQRVVARGQRQRMMALLAIPTVGSICMITLTLTQVDPSYAGPLAGVPLGLPIYHILEDEGQAAIPPDVYEREIGPLEFVLDRLSIADGPAKARGVSG